MESHQLHHSLQLTLPKIAMCSFAFPVKDRKSTRLNSSHSQISYAVFCLKKKKKNITLTDYSSPSYRAFNTSTYSAIAKAACSSPASQRPIQTHLLGTSQPQHYAPSVPT